MIDEFRQALEEFIYNWLKIINTLLVLLTGQRETELIRLEVPQFVRPFLIGMAIASVVTVTQLLIMLASIRRNLLQAFRGDHSEIPRRISTNNTTYAAGNFHFGGYFIGYLLWGYIIVLLIGTVFTALLDLWITYGSFQTIEKMLKLFLPALLIVLFKIFLNKVLAQYVFLRGYGDSLAINNRRTFMIFIYFNFFLDAFLGLVASIMRIVKSAVAGVLYMSRLDYSPLGRKLETLDDAFSAYCGFIHMECAHRHPILLLFVSHLLRQYMEQKEGRKRLSQAQRRWHLAVFLIINPTFVYRRKAFLQQFRVHETRIRLDDHHNITTFFVEQPSSQHHRLSIISENDLIGLGIQQRF
jgi:hypothetical protein